jgi:hypothetical protein
VIWKKTPHTHFLVIIYEPLSKKTQILQQRLNIFKYIALMLLSLFIMMAIKSLLTCKHNWSLYDYSWILFCFYLISDETKRKKRNAPSEARTHDLQITQKMLFNSDYETDALTNCATEAYTSFHFELTTVFFLFRS